MAGLGIISATTKTHVMRANVPTLQARCLCLMSCCRPTLLLWKWSFTRRPTALRLFLQSSEGIYSLHFTGHGTEVRAQDTRWCESCGSMEWLRANTKIFSPDLWSTAAAFGGARSVSR